MCTQEDIIQRRLALLNLAEQLGNASMACKRLGYSRDTYYRVKKLYDIGGPKALCFVSRRKPLLKNRVPAEIEQAVVEMAIQQPESGQIRVCRELLRKNLKISPGGVRSVWLRHSLETRRKRLLAHQQAQMHSSSDSAPQPICPQSPCHQQLPMPTLALQY